MEISCYEIVVFPSLMDQLSDTACLWVIAHELGHAASGLPCGVFTIMGKPYTRIGDSDEYEEVPPLEVHEATANRIALEWGFGLEHRTFLTEAPGWQEG